jgi:hypothetical protein
MTDYTKGGRHKKAPYESTHCRIPLPLKPIVEQLANAYKGIAGLGWVEFQWLKGVEEAIAKAAYPGSEDKPVNKIEEPAKPVNKNAQELVQRYLESCGLSEIPLDEKGKPKARYDQLAKFKYWLENDI